MPTRETTKAGTASHPQPQRRGRRILAAFGFFVVCLLVAEALVGDQGLIATMRARRQYDRLSAELARLQTENSRLREEARRLREDPATIEEIARRELGLMSPGEKLFIIKDVPQKKLPESSHPSQNPDAQ